MGCAIFDTAEDSSDYTICETHQFIERIFELAKLPNPDILISEWKPWEIANIAAGYLISQIVRKSNNGVLIFENGEVTRTTKILSPIFENLEGLQEGRILLWN